MTWVCSAPAFLANATFIADTSVSVDDVIQENLTVQKIHRLGMCAMAGFCGNINLALSIIEGLNSEILQKVGEASHDIKPEVIDKILKEQSYRIYNYSGGSRVSATIVVGHLRHHDSEIIKIHDVRRVVCKYSVGHDGSENFEARDVQPTETIQLGSGCALPELADIMGKACEGSALGSSNLNRPIDHIAIPLSQAIAITNDEHVKLRSSCVNRQLDIGHLSHPVCLVTGFARSGDREYSSKNFMFGIDISNEGNEIAFRRREIAIRGWGDFDQHFPVIESGSKFGSEKIKTATQLLDSLNSAAADVVG